MTDSFDTIVLGGGMTGLAAGYTSGIPVFEAAESPGGICSSYYVKPGDAARHPNPPADENAYRFEIGGGHWIFGGSATVLDFIQRVSPASTFGRKSSVFFHNDRTFIPYPLQNHLANLERKTAMQALAEMLNPPGIPVRTMEDWLRVYFGRTLCDLFFVPFHDLYTAGLYRTIAPQDAYKSPVSRQQVIAGATAQAASSAGYNVTFIYPDRGLNDLAQKLGSKCSIQYGMRAESIDAAERVVTFANGKKIHYKRLISTLPLNKTIEMARLKTEAKPDPYSSVLVLNVGAKRGPRCPDDHWLYNLNTRSRFHRVGFYSNVSDSFVPVSARGSRQRVSIYVERAYPGGQKPTPDAMEQYGRDVVSELQDWEFITEPEVVDPTWIDVAYTWTWPDSPWVKEAIGVLESRQVFPVGRYARWTFQGIADSIRDGFIAGASFR